MEVNISSMLKRYATLTDKEFGRLKPDELTDEGRKAYEHELIRRASPEHEIERQKEEIQFKEMIKEQELRDAHKLKISAYKKDIRFYATCAGIGLFVIIYYIIITIPDKFPIGGAVGYTGMLGVCYFFCYIILRIVIRPPKFESSKKNDLD